jgi:hypothetical protein
VIIVCRCKTTVAQFSDTPDGPIQWTADCALVYPVLSILQDDYYFQFKWVAVEGEENVLYV